MTQLAALEFERFDAILVAHVDGEVDMSNATQIGAAVARRLSNDDLALVLALAQVGYFDSAGIHVLFELRDRLQTRRQELRLVVPTGSPIATALELADVMRTLGAVETVDLALAALRS
jgi:anti-anti-sigma factor